MSHWRKYAACQSKQHLFFPSPANEAESGSWEEASALAAKKVCASCPVFAECASMSLDVSKVPEATQGVFAGLTRWERAWIRRHPKEAVALSRQLADEGIDPILFSLQMLSPSIVPMRLASTPQASAELYGVPLWVAREWHRHTPRQRGTPWGNAVRSMVAAEPDRWFSSLELIDKCWPLIPVERIEAKRKAQRSSKTGTCTEQRAVSSIINGVINTAIARGVFERRKVNGRLEVKATPQLVKESKVAQARQGVESTSHIAA